VSQMCCCQMDFCVLNERILLRCVIDVVFSIDRGRMPKAIFFTKERVPAI
jgi:hypothetical protein